MMKKLFLLMVAVAFCDIGFSAEQKPQADRQKKQRRTDNFTREDFADAGSLIVYGRPDKKPINIEKIYAYFLGKNAVFWGVLDKSDIEREGIRVLKTQYTSEPKSKCIRVNLYAIFDTVPDDCKEGEKGFIFRGKIIRFNRHKSAPIFHVLIDCRSGSHEALSSMAFEKPINIPIASARYDDGLFGWLYAGMLRNGDGIMGVCHVQKIDPHKHDKNLCTISATEISGENMCIEFSMPKDDAFKLPSSKTPLRIDGAIESIQENITDPANTVITANILKTIIVPSGVARYKMNI